MNQFTSEADTIKASAAKHLAEGWARYVAAFGVVPHGTEKQMAALLELSSVNEWLVIMEEPMSEHERELWKEATVEAAMGLDGDLGGIFFCWNWHDALVTGKS